MDGSVVQLWNEWAAAWGAAFLRSCGQGGLCALAAGLVCRRWPRLPAAGRAWLWWLVCLKLTAGLCCLAPPVLPVLPPAFQRLPAAPARPPTLPVAAAPVFTRSAKVILPPSVPPAPRIGGIRTKKAANPTPTAWLGMFWILGVLVLIGRDLRRGLRLQRAVRGFREEVVETDAVRGPQVTGLFRPVILLPRTPFTPEERALALAHERAHLRRGDLWWGLLPTLTRTLFFLFPPARWAAKEYGLAREEACDAEALRVTGAAPAPYARLLLRFASPAAASSPALGLGAGYQALHRRLTTLPHHAAFSPAQRRLGLAGLALALPLALPWRLTAAAPPPGVSRAEAPLPDPATLRFTITDLGLASSDRADAPGWTARRRNEQGRRLDGLDGFPDSRPLDSAADQVVGYAQTGGHAARRPLAARAALWDSAGRAVDLGTLGGDYSVAYGINDRGQIVGKADTAYLGRTHAFLRQGGRMTDLGTLGGSNSLARQISDQGRIVGCAETGRDARTHAALWQGGRIADLNRLVPPRSGWRLQDASAVNDQGRIAGSGLAPDGRRHAFLLTPTGTPDQK